MSRKQVIWCVQQNLTKDSDAKRLRAACSMAGATFMGVDAVPFSDDLPDVPTDVPVVFYGATGFCQKVWESAHWCPGVFFDPAADYKTMVQELGEHCLNAHASFSTMRKFSKIKKRDSDMFFIRPVADSKVFAGQVVSFAEIRQWETKLAGLSHGTLTADESIVVAHPVGINTEWRLWFIGSRMITSSRYKKNGKLAPLAGCPKAVQYFAETIASELWHPCPAEFIYHDTPWVMDVARSGDGLYVLETGCFNSAGFYNANLEQLVCEVSKNAAGHFLRHERRQHGEDMSCDLCGGHLNYCDHRGEGFQ